jgi:hypothetical protein
MVANLATPQDSQLVSSLFKQWRPAIVILLVHSSVSRTDTIAMLPSSLAAFYHKKMFTVHQAIGGVTSASWRFARYTRWPDATSYPLLMTRDNLPRCFQMALLNTIGAVQGVTFKA